MTKRHFRSHTQLYDTMKHIWTEDTLKYNLNVYIHHRFNQINFIFAQWIILYFLFLKKRSKYMAVVIGWFCDQPISYYIYILYYKGFLMCFPGFLVFFFFAPLRAHHYHNIFWMKCIKDLKLYKNNVCFFFVWFF